MAILVGLHQLAVDVIHIKASAIKPAIQSVLRWRASVNKSDPNDAVVGQSMTSLLKTYSCPRVAMSMNSARYYVNDAA